MIVQAVRLLKVLSEHHYATPLGEGTKVSRTPYRVTSYSPFLCPFIHAKSKFESVFFMYMHIENSNLFN
jgi:hypothetical protein